jgi:hypothetical protein
MGISDTGAKNRKSCELFSGYCCYPNILEIGLQVSFDDF